MRIGIDIRHLTDGQPAGVGGYTRQLLEALFCLDQKNTYVLFASGTKSTLARLPKFDYPNVETAYVPVSNKILNAAMLIFGRPYLENVLANGAKRSQEIASSAGGLLAKTRVDTWFFPNHNFIATSLPYAIMVHDLSFEIFPEFFTIKSRVRHRIARRIIKQAKVVLCPSMSTKQDLMQVYGVEEARIVVTALAADVPPISSSHPSQPPLGKGRSPEGRVGSKRYILSLATLEPRKNQLSIIEAYETYRDETGDTIGLVIGGGRGWKSAPVIRAAKRSKYAKDIQLIGYVDEQQKSELYRNAQVFVFPSFYEGFGLPVLEAMRAGCPVITSHTSSLPELVGDAGILIDPYNVNDLTVAIKLILQSERLRTDLIERGKRRAEDFSWQETAKKTLETLESLFSQNRT